MRSRHPVVFLACLALALVSLGLSCKKPFIASVSPGFGEVVTSFAFDVVVELGPKANPSTLEVELNGVPLAMSGGPVVFTASLSPGPPLLDHNQLVVEVEDNGGQPISKLHSFEYLPPKARAFEITDAADCITGPLAHCRVGDWMLANSAARFVVQDAPQRDFNQVGAYGGNLIDAEVVVGGVPQGNDNFWEVQPAFNIESVVNAQSVVIVNDGQDGTAAIIRSCGPDDLLDGINPSAVVGDAGGIVPPGIDDQDYDISGCTEYALEPEQRWVELTTTIENMQASALALYVGDYINGAGELEQWTPPADQAPAALAQAGIGELFANWGEDALSYFGFGEAAGVDYALIGPPGQLPSSFPSSSFTQTGVSYVLYKNAIPLVLGFGAPASFSVPANGDASFTRWFAVGDGSAGNAIDARLDILALQSATLQGCVTDSVGAPVPAARVVAARDSLGGTSSASVLRGQWITRADGCYEGRLPLGSYRVAVAAQGFPYEGSGTSPVTHLVSLPTDGGTTVKDFVLPRAGRLRVEVEDGGGSPIPARVSVVGFDPSPEVKLFASVLGPNDVRSTLFFDQTKDAVPPGLSRTEYTDASGVLEFALEPADYQIAVSRGTEYSLDTELVTIVAGSTTTVEATVVRVLDTTGFISADYHTHMIDSPDSRISQKDRILSIAGEGVENIIATDHSVVTDLSGRIAEIGAGSFLHSTPGEEITTFDTGHFNAYPQGLDPSRAQTRGATDWAGAAPPGEDFPSFGNYILSPAQVEAAVLADPDNAGLGTVVQINHIGSHFFPLQIDTSLTPPASLLPSGPCILNEFPNPNGLETGCFRLDPGVANFFHPFPALEIWNGSDIEEQRQLLEEEIGIWMNLLNQGLPTTAIADTDTHTLHNLVTAGARTWTPSSTDDPADIVDAEIGPAILAGKAVGGQGIYVQTQLYAASTGQTADFSLAGSTSVETSDGAVTLTIQVQAPTWAPYDTIEVYRNAETTPTLQNGGTDVYFCANPSQVLTLAGSDTPTTFTVQNQPVGGAARLETTKQVSLSGLTQDAWIAVVVKGSAGTSPPMFPVYPDGTLAGPSTENPTLAALSTVGAVEAGIRSLGLTNALYVDADGVAGFDPPGVAELTTSPNCAD